MTIKKTGKRRGNLTLCEALASWWEFDWVNDQHSGELTQNFSRKSNAQGFAWGYSFGTD